jgi:cytochrome c peroxidase
LPAWAIVAGAAREQLCVALALALLLEDFMRVAYALFLLVACGDGKSATPDGSTTSDSPPMADAADPPILSAADLAELAKLSPLPAAPADPTNAYADNAAAARLGQMLFFDKSYSGAIAAAAADTGTNGGLGSTGDVGKVSCASCHAVGSESLDDRRSQPGKVSVGTAVGTRNALGAVNSAYYKWTNWGGRFDSQWALPTAVAEGGATMNSTRLTIAHMLYVKYRAEYNAIFPTALDTDLDPLSTSTRFPASGKPGQTTFDTMAQADKDIVNRIYANYAKALAAYMRKLTSRNAPFDRFMAGDKTAISISAQRGAKLFLTKGCVGCHSGPNFSDDQFHALVAPDANPSAPDMGRFTDVGLLLGAANIFSVTGAFSDDTNTGKLTGLAQDNAQKGQFRTKSLRNIAESAPYMHSGQLATLDAVIDFYDQGGGDPGASGITKDTRMMPLGLSAGDKADLVELMKSLSGEAPPVAVVVDISK